MYVISENNETFQVPGDFSNMTKSDYIEGNYQSKSNIGSVYFYYMVNGKIYLVISQNNYTSWEVRELTGKSIGIPSNSKIKTIRIYGTYGYIFYVSDGVGEILYSSSEGEYWEKLELGIDLNDNSTLKFLNEYGMTVDGFITVPSDDNESCDLYKIDGKTLTKIEIDTDEVQDKQLDYYNMPSYISTSTVKMIMKIGENENDENGLSFISKDSGTTWISESEYYEEIEQAKINEEKQKEEIENMIDNLDETIFLKDFENYSPDNNNVVISEEKAKQIAEKGFEESAKRIASEGITDTYSSYEKIEEVSPNNYFTAKDGEYNKSYTNIKRKAYIFTKENNMGCGVSIYVDVTTGLIIGGACFGD